MGMTIIKNYGMPHNCYDCDLHNYHECDLTGESIEEDYCWNGDSREKHCPLREVEAIPKANYETRLKADMVAMLTEIQLEIQEIEEDMCIRDSKAEMGFYRWIKTSDAENIIQQKINAFRGENGNE